MAQDIGFSVRRQGFDSPRGYLVAWQRVARQRIWRQKSPVFPGFFRFLRLGAQLCGRLLCRFLCQSCRILCRALRGWQLSPRRYRRHQPAGWADGDWNGGRVFDVQDFVAAFIDGGYLAARRSAVRIDLSLVDIAASDLVHSASVERSTPRFAIPLFDRPFANHSKSPTDPREYFFDAISQEVIAHFHFYDAADLIVAPFRSIETKTKASTNHSGRITSDRIIAIESGSQKLAAEGV